MRLPGRRGGRETAGRLRSAAALLLAAAALEACVAFAPPQCPAPPQAQGQGASPRTAPLGRLSRRSAPTFSPAGETVQLRRPSPCSRPGGAAGRLYSQLRLYSPGPAGGEGGGAAPEPAEPRRHAVRVRALPPWLTPVKRLLGPGEWRVRPATDGTLEAAAMLTRTEACLLAARTRGLGFGGRRLELEAKPTLPRNAVRAARTEEARNRRASSPGFTKKGVKLDEEGKFSLTPQLLAEQLANRVPPRASLVDATCGAGGNAIAFARAGCSVTAIDTDEARLGLARHNARIYGVEDRISFLHGDAREVLPNLTADILFVDVPWGQEYNKEAMSLEDLPLLCDLLSVAQSQKRFDRILAKVPPSFDPASTPYAKPEAWFGHGDGDYRRVKFLMLSFEGG